MSSTRLIPAPLKAVCKLLAHFEGDPATAVAADGPTSRS